MDQAGVLSERTQVILTQLLQQANNREKVQLQILTLKSLNDYTIEQASILITDQWKLGSKGKDNGVLLIVVPDEKKARIEVGKGLEGDIPDVIAKRILADVSRPYFKKNQYNEGILAATLEILKIADPEFSLEAYGQSLPQSSDQKHNTPIFIILIILFVILSKLSGFGGPGRRGLGGFGGRGGFGGGFGGGGFGGGGGWSGGGGGFSGGGSSDSW